MKSNSCEVFWDRVLVLIRDHKMTLKGVCAQLNLNYMTIYSQARRKGDPDFAFIQGISELFGISLEEMMTPEPDMNSDDKEVSLQKLKDGLKRREEDDGSETQGDIGVNDNLILKRNIDYLKYILRLDLKTLASILGVKYNTLYYQYHHVSALPKETIGKLAELADVDVDVFLANDLWELKRESAEKINTFLAQSSQVGIGEITIPMVSQKLSAGYGEEMIAPEDMEYRTLNLMQQVAPGIPKKSLMCAEVRGDSMINEKIYPGDIVVFAQGVISGNGIYVLSIDNELFVKRVEFDPLSHTITIISANDNYKPKTTKDDDQSLRVIGVVTGWFHANRIF